MANAQQAPTKPGPKLVPGEYENRTRTRWVLEHPEGDLVFGDSKDRDVPKAERNHNLRDPVVPISAATLETMPEHSKTFLATLLAKGHVELRRAAA